MSETTRAVPQVRSPQEEATSQRLMTQGRDLATHLCVLIRTARIHDVGNVAFHGPLVSFIDTVAQIFTAEGEFKIQSVGDYLYLGPSKSLDDYVNHSCDPNAALIVDDVPHVFLAALRDIEPGEEVTYDYSVTMFNDDWEIHCNCGSTICRGKIQEFMNLSPAVQNRYRALGIVPKYILDKMGRL